MVLPLVLAGRLGMMHTAAELEVRHPAGCARLAALGEGVQCPSARLGPEAACFLLYQISIFG